MDGAFIVTWKELLIAGILVLAVYIAELLLLMYSGRSRGVVRLWQRGTQTREVFELRKEVAELKERVAKLESAESVASADDAEKSGTPYSRAFGLAKQGLDVGQVAASCGISRAEAELIVAMQRGSGSG